MAATSTATAASATASASPATASEPVGRAALAAALTTASIAAAAAVLPPAASASAVGGGAAGLTAAAASVASAATSGWLAIEELLEEAAYSLSQEVPDGPGRSPLEALARLASTSDGGSGSSIAAGAGLDLDLPQQLQGLLPPQVAESLAAGPALPVSLSGGLGSGPGGLGLASGGAAGSGSGGLLAAVPGGDRLSEVLEDLLYSLSQEINPAAAQDAVLSAAMAAAAGLAGAAEELPRAAASVYHSAAEAAAAAAAARAASAARVPSGGGSGGTALVVPDESQTQLAMATGVEYGAGEEYDMELDGVDDMTVAAGNLAWDPYDSVRAAEGALDAMVPDASAADAAVAAASSAVVDATAAVLPPIITASAAPSVADAATATALAVVEAATTAAAGTITINPPSVATLPSASAEPAAAAAAATAVSAAMAGEGAGADGQMGVYGMDPLDTQQLDELTTALQATLQSSLDMVEAALSGIRSADSTLVGGVTIAAVLAVVIRSLVSMAGAALSRTRGPGGGGGEAGGGGGGSAAAAARMRPVGVTALEAAAALNNDPQALLLDIRNGSDVQEQGLPDLRPFRRGAGATTVPLPYCDFRTTPTLANPSGSLLAAAAATGPAAGSPRGGKAAAAAALAPVAGPVTVSVDPLFCSKFKQLEGLNRDSRVFLMDSYGVEAPEAVLLLRSDLEVEGLLGAQGVKFVEGGFAGPEGWKPDLNPLTLLSSFLIFAAIQYYTADISSCHVYLPFMYPSLFGRTLAVGAVGGAGVAAASSLDWASVSRGAVGLAAAMLLTDRVLPPGVRPSGKIRQYLQSQLSDPQPNDGGSGASAAADLAAARRRTALLLRALDLAEAVGDAVVRAGGAAVAAAGSAARGAIAASGGGSAAAAAATAANAGPADVEAELETPPPPAAAAATIVLPHGMDSRQWSEAAEMAVAQVQQQQPAAPPPPENQTRSASPLQPKWRLGPSAPSAGSSSNSVDAVPASTAAAFSNSPPPPPPPVPRAPSPSVVGRLNDALRSAADAVVRAASPSSKSSAAAASRAGSPGGPSGGGSSSRSQPDTLELMTALATASALSNVDNGLLPGWPALNFPKASAGQMPQQPQLQPVPKAGDSEQEEEEEKDRGEMAPAATGRRGPIAKERQPAAAAAEQDNVPLFSSLSALSASYNAAEATALADMWSNWRQDLEAVAPPPPALPSSEDYDDEDDEGEVKGRRDSGSGDSPSGSRFSENDGRGRLYGSGDTNAVAASAAMPHMDLAATQRFGIPTHDRPASAGASTTAVGASSTAPLAGAAWKSATNSGADGSGAVARQQQQQQQRKPLRTSSPERAAAGGAALRRLRMRMDARDDDGLASGAYGSGSFFGGSSGDEGSNGDGGDGPAAAATAAGKRYGSTSAAVPASGTAWTEAWGRSAGAVDGGGGRGLPSCSPHSVTRRKQSLRTASPQRAAAAAAAMRQLRAEMGLPPNDGTDAADAVFARDWRRELDAAAAAAADTEPSGSASESEWEAAAAAATEPGDRTSLYGSVGGTASNGRTASGSIRSRNAAAVGATAAFPRSPSNWRVQVEGLDRPDSSTSSSSSRGFGGVPADWRTRIESGAPATATAIAADGLNGQDSSGSAAASIGSVYDDDVSTSGNNRYSRGSPYPSSPGGSRGSSRKLGAAERAARTARLQDWRARV
ncbi:hypothetical protein VOLCADRAFT_97019 [Volvox carteri f. nagariensis]|uniref:Rhodanese domain-containing protein n=1 Tax=Volvox carteri f. nagariensis TaxID=3068 RepID=D8UBP2_VOLCA|nr:uncharacterized protein VOLCADRAFT_97019 [Volvox carteri f. nagariensis]EFJ42801.1 hypothetical protein VOLCADRAFT_97019 [Volvox carteri f. nagariensis]|eukprot:XP_002956061.1 hypothetical protein VOLCADRAFT_97019 [Volvox carteri f. nagariensis]